jgi:hypothetical protein
MSRVQSHVHQQGTQTTIDDTTTNTANNNTREKTYNPTATAPAIPPVMNNFIAPKTPLPLRDPSTELHFAITNASISTVSHLLSSSTLDKLIADNTNAAYHPLHSAAALGMVYPNCEESVQLCRMFMEKGGDVNCRDKDGNTPLFWAVRSTHVKLVKLLLTRNCLIGEFQSINRRIVQYLFFSLTHISPPLQIHKMMPAKQLSIGQCVPD